jgi:hypothetical protein
MDQPSILYVGNSSRPPFADFLAEQGYLLTWVDDRCKDFPGDLRSLSSFDLIWLACETQFTRHPRIWDREDLLIDYTMQGGRLVLTAPVVLEAIMVYQNYHLLLPARPYRRSSAMRNTADQVMVADGFPCRLPVRPEPGIPDPLSAIADWPDFQQGERGRMFSALPCSHWRDKPGGEVWLRTTDGQPALSLQTFYHGKTALLMEDIHQDGGQNLLTWSHLRPFVRELIADLLGDRDPVESEPAKNWLDAAFPGYRPRPPFEWQSVHPPPESKNLPGVSLGNWRTLTATGREHSLIADNQLSYGGDPGKFFEQSGKFAGFENRSAQEELGIGNARFYFPLTYFESPAVLTLFDEQGAVLNYALADAEASSSANPSRSYQWQPGWTHSKFTDAQGKLLATKTVAVKDNVVEVVLDWNGKPPTRIRVAGGCRYAAKTQISDGELLARMDTGVYTTLWLSESAAFEVARENPLSYRADFQPKNSRLIMRFAAGMEMEAVRSAASRGDTNDPILPAVERTWDEFFDSWVPPFVCDDVQLMQAYAKAFACYRLNVHDIPYEPWLVAYSCPTKTHFDPQWEQDDLQATAIGRWANDRRLAIGQLMGPYRTGVVLNGNATVEDLTRNGRLGPYLSELEQYALAQSDLYWMEQCPSLREELIACLRQDERLHDELMERDKATGLAVTFNCLGMDDSPRWDFISEDDETQWYTAFSRGVICPDLNTTVAVREELLAQLLESQGAMNDAGIYRNRARKRMRAVEASLWNEANGFYFDRAVDTREFSNVKTPMGFLPLMFSRNPRRAKRACRHFWDAGAFHTPFLLPSVSRDHPEFDADSYWRGAVWNRTNWFAAKAFAGSGRWAELSHLIRNHWQLIRKDGVSARENFHPLSGEKKCAALFTEGLSSFIDLFLSYVVGFQPIPGGFRLKPVCLREDHPSFKWGPFYFLNEWLTVEWHRPSGTYSLIRSMDKEQFSIENGTFERSYRVAKNR